MPAKTEKTARVKGFNLVEAAIVLGIIGLVIGGIWSAASAMRTEHKVNQLYEGVLKMADISRPLLSYFYINDIQDFRWNTALLNQILPGKLAGFGNLLNCGLTVWIRPQVPAVA